MGWRAVAIAAWALVGCGGETNKAPEPEPALPSADKAPMCEAMAWADSSEWSELKDQKARVTLGKRDDEATLLAQLDADRPSTPRGNEVAYRDLPNADLGYPASMHPYDVMAKAGGADILVARGFTAVARVGVAEGEERDHPEVHDLLLLRRKQ